MPCLLILLLLPPLPSPKVPFHLPGIPIQLSSTPRALTHVEILEIVDAFVRSAVMCVEAGFDGMVSGPFFYSIVHLGIPVFAGVQIHSAHGNPKKNKQSISPISRKTKKKTKNRQTIISQ